LKAGGNRRHLAQMPNTLLPDRALIRVSGAEARPFLQGLVTQDVDHVAPGQPRWSALLTTQGKALFDFLLWDDGENILIDCEAGQREALARRLGLYRLRHGVTEGVAELGQDKTLWLECNARELHGTAFTKGCFIGQENTARMHYRSKVNRRLVVAPLAEPGDRTRATYPELGLMVELRRVEDLGDALMPTWLAETLAAAE